MNLDNDVCWSGNPVSQPVFGPHCVVINCNNGHYAHYLTLHFDIDFNGLDLHFGMRRQKLLH